MEWDPWREPTRRRLTRSRTERMWAGVAGGLAEYFDIDPVLVRVVWVIAAVVTAGVVAVPLYILLWFIMPQDERHPAPGFGMPSFGGAPPGAQAPPRSEASDEDAGPSSTETPQDEAPSNQPAGEDWMGSTSYGGYGSYGPYGPPPPFAASDRRHRQRSAGFVLIVLGLLFLVGQTGIYHWINWRFFWPVVLVALGVALLMRRHDSWRG